MNWRRKRQLLIALIVLSPIIIILLLWWFLSRPEPTCFDGIQNQNETGVDCGGVCGNICQEDIANPVVSWARTFQISGNVYNAVARIEIPESNLVAEKVPYVLRLYDSEGILISEEERRVDIPPSTSIAVFVPSINPGNRTPVRATVQFSDDVEWERITADSVEFRMTDSAQIRDGSFGTEVSVPVTHNSNQVLSNVTLTLILFDSDGNAIHTSQTFVEEFNPDDTISLTFTWPQTFSSEIDSVLILPTSYRLDQ
ncbi:MAG: hypothetical protein WDZ70_00410 [Candidatus Paceibacterota bacterium]